MNLTLSAKSAAASSGANNFPRSLGILLLGEPMGIMMSIRIGCAGPWSRHAIEPMTAEKLTAKTFDPACEYRR